MDGLQNRSQGVTRRGFLKTALATGAIAASAGGMATAETWLSPAKAVAQSADERVAYTYHNEHCLCNCMLKCTVRDGRLSMIEPRPNEDNRFHNVCLKGISEIQHIYGDARIQSPMRRVGERGSGEFEVITWEEAFKTIAREFKKCQDTYGEDALWIQYSTEAQQRLKPLIASILHAQAGGMNGYDMGQGNGLNQAFAFSGMFALNTMWEWPQAKTVLMVNCNVLETGMMWSRGFFQAQEAGTKMIVCDPRFSTTASKADEWVALRPGTDPALFLGMIHHILEAGLYDTDHIMANTHLPFLIDAETGELLDADPAGTAEAMAAYEQAAAEAKAAGTELPEDIVKPAKKFMVWDGAQNAAVRFSEATTPALEGTFTVNGRKVCTLFTRLREEMAEYTLEWTEKITNVPASQIASVAEQYAEGPSIICNGVGGIDKYGSSDIAGHCYALIASLTGNYGKRGTGCGIYCYHVTPYEAELGGWRLPEDAAPSPSPLGFYDMVRTDKVHAAMFFGDIPTQKAANWNKTLEWINSLDFICVADIYHSSVCDYVDMILPSCSKFESADSVGGVKCANGYILQNQKIIDPLFESKQDFYIEKGIAEAMGYGELYPATAEEYAAATLKSDDPMVEGFTLEALSAANGALKLLGTEDPLGPEVGMDYHTPSGKQEPYYENMLSWGQAFPAWESPVEAYVDNPLREKYPLMFTQSRTRFRVHSCYSGAKWIQQFYEPHIELNPVDAAARGLSNGDDVEVFNDRGSFRTKVLISDAIQPDMAYMAESTYAQYMNGTLMQSVSNDQLTERGYDLLFGPMIPYNDTLIEIKKVGA